MNNMLLYVKNLPKFFSIVDECKEPVMIGSEDGKEGQDLRNNKVLQHVLTTVHEDQTATKIQITLNESSDTMKMLDFMISGGE